ncbi:response regulator transcription factor [Clostridiaceae bacterium Marseille-Q4145]|nr:response regulator transcription factor [Clostridiaceae bacterium Marseille-Q4145]
MKPMIRILVIEDERNILNFITSVLESQDYQVIPASNAVEGLSQAASSSPDLILLDLGLPDLDGTEVIQKIRTWSAVPILVISARTQEQDKVQALDLGADDYITKPFGNSELLARIRTALRHTLQQQTGSDLLPHPYHHGSLTIDFEKRLVTRDGMDIHLTQNEYKIVALLAQNNGRVLTYDKLIEYVWGPYSENDNTSLRVHMANIRRKLEPNPAEPIYLFTEIGVGYRMAEEDA